MSRDAELEALRAGVSCAVVLERHPPPWRLDKRESTRNCLKYRRGTGEIVLVTHEGRGWWDPGSAAKGDVFSLVQHLERGLNLGEVRKILRPLAGLAPTFPEHLRAPSNGRASATPADRWARRRPIQPGDPAWTYLAEVRAIPTDVLAAAAAADCIRAGTYGSAWFAHRRNGAVSHVEIRGPHFRGSLRGGAKTLFRFGAPASEFRRLAVLEAPIDALSFAALEGRRADTLYVATGGGMGPGTVEALQELLRQLRGLGGECVSATDANKAGDRYAALQAGLAADAGVSMVRARPPEGLDWNDVLKGRGA